jgi:hypothetical protein
MSDHTHRYGCGALQAFVLQAGRGSTGIFQLEEHTERRSTGARSCNPFTRRVMDAQLAVVRETIWKAATFASDLDWFRKLGVSPGNTFIDGAAWTWGAYLGEKAARHSCQTSSFTHHPSTSP